MTTEDWNRAAKALAIWTGIDHAAYPQRRLELLIEQYGEEEASRLLPLVKELYRDFSSSDASLTAPNHTEMERRATAEFKERHPNAPEEAIKVLAWCYTWDYK